MGEGSPHLGERGTMPKRTKSWRHRFSSYIKLHLNTVTCDEEPSWTRWMRSVS